jgi:gas vesicle protein
VTWALLTDSHQPLYGVLLGVVVVGALGLLFSPAAVRWSAQA